MLGSKPTWCIHLDVSHSRGGIMRLGALGNRTSLRNARNGPIMQGLPGQRHCAVGLSNGVRVPGVCHIGSPHQHLCASHDVKDERQSLSQNCSLHCREKMPGTPSLHA